jgi:phosphoribosylglycinamide formyltransferase-1
MNVGVLVSGRGSNLQALLDRLQGGDTQVVAVGSNKAEAPALRRAREADVPVKVFAQADYPGRAAHDLAMADWLQSKGAEIIVLAGYMALLDPVFIGRFPDRIVNVHPSLLPAFPGVRAVEEAVAYGVKVFGVTVHLVDEGVDTGAILAQRAVELGTMSDPAEVHQHIQRIEHELLPEVVLRLARGEVRRDPGNPRRLLVG